MSIHQSTKESIDQWSFWSVAEGERQCLIDGRQGNGDRGEARDLYLVCPDGRPYLLREDDETDGVEEQHEDEEASVNTHTMYEMTL